MGSTGRLVAALIMVMTMFGCDYFAQKDLRPGESTADDVRRRMGKPETVWEEAGGAQVLEYVRGPQGHQTWMVEIGPDGRYRGMRNVLANEHFVKVQPGMSRDDVRRLLGKPTETAFFKLKKEEVWSWKHAAGQGKT